jgi:hypothetical protein
MLKSWVPFAKTARNNEALETTSGICSAAMSVKRSRQMLRVLRAHRVTRTHLLPCQGASTLKIPDIKGVRTGILDKGRITAAK